MATSKVTNLPKATAELEINIPWEEVKSTYQKIFDSVASKAEIPGFRKGKAPKKVVEKNIDKNKIYGKVIQDIIPKVYREAIKKHNLTPIISPKVEIVKAKENEDWVVKATIALKPKVNLKDYKGKIQNLKKSKVKIWTPGEKEQNNKKESNKLTLEELTKVLHEIVEVEFSDLLTEQEVNRLLSDLIDQTKKLGLTIDQYLMAKGKTSEKLREEYKEQAKRNLSLEFTLAEIADKENITVAQKDIDDLISKVKEPKEKEKIKKNSYYLARLIRQQKTLDFLANL